MLPARGRLESIGVDLCKLVVQARCPGSARICPCTPRLPAPSGAARSRPRGAEVSWTRGTHGVALASLVCSGATRAMRRVGMARVAAGPALVCTPTAPVRRCGPSSPSFCLRFLPAACKLAVRPAPLPVDSLDFHRTLRALAPAHKMASSSALCVMPRANLSSDATQRRLAAPNSPWLPVLVHARQGLYLARQGRGGARCRSPRRSAELHPPRHRRC